MKRAAAILLTIVRVALCAVVLGEAASADELKMVGTITHIELAGPDARTATATLKDTKAERTVDVIINDDLTLDKLKDHRIVEGDEIRCKYEVKDGKNVSTYFRKTAGC